MSSPQFLDSILSGIINGFWVDIKAGLGLVLDGVSHHILLSILTFAVVAVGGILRFRFRR